MHLQPKYVFPLNFSTNVYGINKYIRFSISCTLLFLLSVSSLSAKKGANRENELSFSDPIFTSPSLVAFAENGTGTVLDVNANDGEGAFLNTNDYDGMALSAQKVTNVTSTTSNGSIAKGFLVSIQVTFDQTVEVTGTPQLELETGNTDRKADYSSGSSTNTLTFTYRVQEGDESADLDYKATTSLTLNGGTIGDTNFFQIADLTLPSPGASGSLGANKALVIDGISPTITNISSTAANGTYGIGDVIPIVVTFSEEMSSGAQDDNITLETGTLDIEIFLPTISGNQLTFDYTVESGHSSSDLNVNSYFVSNGKDLAGNLIDPSLPSGKNLANNKNIVIDTSPKITNVTSSTSNGSIARGLSVSIQVTFDQTVEVTGTPQLELETGNTDRKADYSSGSGTNTLTFTYRVKGGDESSDLDYKSTGSLTLNGGTIQNIGSVDTDLTLPIPGASGSLSANKDLVIDGVEPTITNISSTAANGTYGIGDVIPIVVTFSEEMSSGAQSDHITLETGTLDINIFSPTISGNQLTFDYTVESAHSSSDLNVKSYFGFNGKDLAGNLIDPSLPSVKNLANNKNIVIDTSPKIANVTSSTSNGSIAEGLSVSIQVTFDQTVEVTGTPQLELETGNTDRKADYSSGSGTNTWTFTYRVKGGDESSDLDYKSTGSLTLNGGTIQNSGSVDTDLTLPIPGASGSLSANKDLVIDGIEPTITNISSTAANGTYGIGDVIPIVVTFSEEMSSGAQDDNITLETGTLDIEIFLPTISGNQLIFDYTVESGHSSSDLSVNSYFVSNGKDLAGNLIDPSLPSVKNLANNKNIVIDAEVPTITSGTSETFEENGIGTIYTITATDDTDLSFSVSSGNDEGLFDINASTGAVTFKTAPDFENPTDNGANNTYVINVIATDAAGNSANQDVTITVTDKADETAPFINSDIRIGLNANANQVDIPFNEGVFGGSGAGPVEPDDFTLALTNNTTVDTPVITSITNTNDGTLVGGETTLRVHFGYNGTAEGDESLTFTPVADAIFDAAGNAAPTEQNNNILQLHDETAPTVTITSGTSGALYTSNYYFDLVFSEGVTGLKVTDFTANFSVSQTEITLSTENIVTDLSGITSLRLNTSFLIGDSESNTIMLNLLENSMVDRAGNPVPATSFTSTEIVDKTIPGLLILGIDANNAQITGQFTEVVYGNNTASDPVEPSDLTLSVSGGTASGASITSITNAIGGALVGGEQDILINIAFVGTPNGSETITVEATDNESIFDLPGNFMPTPQGGGNTVRLSDIYGPVFSSGTSASYVENGTEVVYTATATDLDEFTFKLGSNKDEALFTIGKSTGELTFVSSPDFENPQDGDGNNEYEVEITASDRSNITTHTVTVTVSDVDDAPPTVTSFTSDDSELIPGETAVLTLVFDEAISGLAAEDFTVPNGAISEPTSSDGGSTYTATYTPNAEIEDATNEIVLDLTGIADQAGNAGVGTSKTANFTLDSRTPSLNFATTSSSGAETVTSVDLEVGLALVSGVDITVDYVVTGTAIGSGTDYTLANGTMTFLAGTTSKNITIAGIINDAIAETDETVIVTLSNPTNADLITNSAVHTYTITDDDAATLSIGDVTQTEGNSGTSIINIPVTLTGQVQDGFTVEADALLSGDAAEIDANDVMVSVDPIISSTTLIFVGNNGETQNLQVTLKGDEVVENDETFAALIGDVQADGKNVTIVDGDATITITNDDAATLSIDDISINEGDNGQTNEATFTVSLNGAVENTFSVDANLVGGTIQDSDYISAGIETLGFTGTLGETKSYSLTITGDDLVELDETFSVFLSNLSASGLNVTITDDTGAGVILNDDAAPVVTSTVTATVEENTIVTGYTAAATDADAGTLSFNLGSGNDGALFSINSSSGVLSFLQAPDFENPQDGDGNNQYLLTIKVSDGANEATKDITVNVTNLNETPVFTSANSVRLAENELSVFYTATATDEESESVTFSLENLGLDDVKALLNLNESTGELSFVSAPDFETMVGNTEEGDSYEVTFIATDASGNQTSQELTITILDVNEAPVFLSNPATTVNDNQTYEYFGYLSDPDDFIPFNTSNRASANVPSWLTFESFLPSTTDIELYDTDEESYLNEEEAEFLLGANHMVRDSEGNVILAIENGPSKYALFKITPEGALSVLELNTSMENDEQEAEGEYELEEIVAMDIDASDNIYLVQKAEDALLIKVSPEFNVTEIATDIEIDQVLFDVLDIEISETGEELLIINDNGSLFNLNLTTNEVEEISEPSDIVDNAFIAKNSAGEVYVYLRSEDDADDVRLIQYQPGLEGYTTTTIMNLSDNSEEEEGDGDNESIIDQDDILANVTDMLIDSNDQLWVASGDLLWMLNAVSNTFEYYASNETLETFLEERETEDLVKIRELKLIAESNGLINYTYVGGLGLLAPGSNVFLETEEPLTVSEATRTISFTARGRKTSLDLSIFSDVNSFATNEEDYTLFVEESSLFILRGGEGFIFEHELENKNDPEETIRPDREDIWKILGVNADGSFILTMNNSLVIQVSTEDIDNYLTDIENNDRVYLPFTFLLDDFPVQISSAVISSNNEFFFSSSAGLIKVDTVTGELITVIGEDDEFFEVLGEPYFDDLVFDKTGALYIADSENGIIFKLDLEGNLSQYVALDGVNYLAVSDKYLYAANEGGLYLVKSEGELIALSGDGLNTEEENTFQGIRGINFSASEGLIYIIDSGELRQIVFEKAAFKLSGNAQGNVGTHSISILLENEDIISGDQVSATQEFDITVLDVTAPVIISLNEASFAENGTDALLKVTAEDTNPNAVLTYELSGTDAALFSINQSDHDLTFKESPDFETPADEGTDNVYNFTITVKDDADNEVSQDFTLTVNDLNDESPVITNAATVSIDENTTSVVTLTATDSDANSTLAFSIIGGADQSLFELDGAALSLVSAEDFDNPSQEDQTYEVVVEVTDGANTTSQTIAVRINDLNDESPVITNATNISISENTTSVVTLTASDSDANST
ncbi:cadherin domain-containing protein, partial [Roseivirga sp.]|uniref:cadherin domain-containing protein n=1 Tax=Roseivirga sp. TaxID=1964215 RepID=UPI003B8DD98F